MDLQVGEALGGAYRTAAETLAERVSGDATAFAKVVPCATSEATCSRTYVETFGRKVYRRPLTSQEVTAYLALFAEAPELVDGDTDAFSKGVQVTLEAFFQSPSFLYRAELATEAQEDLIPLTGYEVAARLALMLANTTPDDTLLDAAEAGELGTPAAVAQHAERLLDVESLGVAVEDFHFQWLELETYANKLTKDSTRFPSVTPALAPTLQDETTRFLRTVLLDDQRGYTSLLTAPFTFVNDVTADLYGLSGSFGADLVRAELDPTQRAGLLTQVGFLATHAFSNLSSPIHRGVFVQRRVLCTKIPDPPANIPDLPPLDGTLIRTTRQQVDQHTAPSPCNECHHAIINPVGFAFEHYDAVGRWRTEENGVAIDSSGTLVGTAAEAPFGDAVELSHAIAESPEGRDCYARNWLRYTFGRDSTTADACALEVLTERLGDDDYGVKRLLVDLTQTKAFLYRSATETTP